MITSQNPVTPGQSGHRIDVFHAKKGKIRLLSDRVARVVTGSSQNPVTV